MRAVRLVHRIVLSVALLAAFLAGAGRAAAEENDTPIKPEARVRFARGLEYYKMREFEAAIAEFEAAYAIDARFEIMFAQAQAERLSGDCASAVRLYRRFLASDPPAMHAEAARASLDKCETALKSQPEGDGQPGASEPARPSGTPAGAPGGTPAPVEAQEGGAAEASGPPPRAPEPRAHRPFWKDPVGDALAGAGLIAVGVGVGLFVASSSDAAAADEATLQSEHARLLDRAEQRRTLAIVGVGAGSALLVGAVVRWMWPRGEEQTQVALDVRGGGATLVLAGSF